MSSTQAPNPTSEAPPPPLTIGTAGHIDHGKTLLIEALTGMRADRPYERERGMTIDIGYAEMRDPHGRRIGFVDLPKIGQANIGQAAEVEPLHDPVEQAVADQRIVEPQQYRHTFSGGYSRAGISV